ncbi:MAG: FG-GAP-like repeat-containing protein [Pyrinomonadaceae bacterium]|nr:FG-GAP-like repeat-containing protein [Pyrinomonadaceae bacterium]
MKLRISTILIATFLFIMLIPAAVPDQICTPVPTGAISWWSAENNGGDRFGRNNAVLFGDTTFVAGRVGQAFNFDGSGDYAQVATTSSLPVGASPRTVELWFKTSVDLTSQTESGLMQYGSAGGGNMFGLITSANAPGKLYFYGHSADLAGTTTLLPNTWYHGAVTYDGTTIKLYVNGQLENQAAIGLNTVLESYGLVIGHRAGGSFWTGQIDEPAIYDRELSASEIAAIYNAGSAGKCSTPCAPLPNGLVSWWAGEGNTLDRRGLNNGQSEGNLTYTTGRVGQAFNLDGVAADIKVPGSSSLNVGVGNGMTVEMWVKPSDLYQRPLVEWNQNANLGVQFWIGGNFSSGTLTANLKDTADGSHIVQTPTAVMTANVWQHVALTYDRPSGLATIYLNGNIVAGPVNIGSVSLKTWSEMYIGSRPLGNQYVGQLDEVRIFDRALSQDELTSIYDAGSEGICSANCVGRPANVISWWPAEDNALDERGLNNGTLVNGAGFDTGMSGRAFKLDGVDDHVSVGNLSQLQNATEITVMAWIYAQNTSPSIAGIVGKWNTNTAADNVFLLNMGPNASAQNGGFWVAFTDGTNGWTTGSTPIPTNRWIHIAGTWRSSDGSLTIYKNGFADGTVTVGAGKVLNYLNTYTAKIGEFGGRDLYFKGLIDDPAIFSRALTQTEIRSIVAAGSNGICRQCSSQPNGLISWWQGEDNVHDAIGGNYGVLLGGAAFAPGRVGRAFSFNGSTAAVRIPDNPTLDVTTEFTLGAWIKPTVIPNYPNGSLVISKVGPIGNLNGYQMTVTNIGGVNKIWCGFNTGGNNWPQYTTTGGSVPVADWSYVACSYDHNTLAVYQNGEQVGSSVVGPVTVANTSSNLKLGSDDVAQQFYAGLIDEPMIFGRALALNEIRAIYDAGSLGVCQAAPPTTPSCGAIPPGMISWWRGQDNALDRRKGHPGFLWGPPAYTTGKVGKAFDFAANNEAVDVGTWFDLQTFSIEMWVKPKDAQLLYADIIDNNHNSTPLRSWVLESLGTGNVFQWYSADFPAGTNILFDLVPNSWQHIVITRDANRVTRGYLNRSLVGTVTTSADIPYDGSQNLRIGNWYPGLRAFNGTIDEVTVYNRSLSESEVAMLYNADSFGKCVGTQTMADMDGDMLSDLAIFRPSGASGAEWWWLKSTGGNGAVQFGSATDTVVTADYTGDGKTDVAFWRPSTGEWYILRSEDYSFYAFPFGSSSDVPVPADYDGDGRADAAVFRASNTTWYISRSTGGTGITQFGAAGDKPVVEDYDGDGKADIAVFRPNGTGGAEWWIAQSSGGVFATQFGQPTDKAVPADYTGDGRADIAFWMPSNGFWYVLRSDDYSYYAFPFGASGDLPVPADYDGDAKTDAGVYRPATANWFISRSKDGLLIRQFGSAGDVPVPNAFVR